MQPQLWEKVLRTVQSGQQPTQEQWQALTAEERTLIEQLQQERLSSDSIAFLDQIDEEKAWGKLSGNIQAREPRIIKMHFLKYAAIFAGILVLGGLTIFLLRKKDDLPQPFVAGTYMTAPIDPNRAVLVLADGQQVELEKRPNSVIQQGQTEIVNSDKASLRYSAAGEVVKPAGWNTLITPRGGRYKIELADGSEIWLNAETQIRYPAHFGGVNTREVVLERGEAYFKVRRNAELPFVVTTAGMHIQVLGTEFNVNTYTKDYATTLVNGSVRLSAGSVTTTLQPGQQGVLGAGQFTKVSVDVETYTGWKDDLIIYEEAPLEEVMNSLGRQYDLTVEFTSPQIKDRKFGGRLKRTPHIEDVLAIIEKTGSVKFSIKGKTIYVSPASSK